MRIELLKMQIENFKGIQSFEVVFSSKKTVISGRNETGKTTVADAFFWVMFGKDSSFRTKFDVIPLDNKNNPIHHLETMVELLFTADGEEHKIKRVLTELWVKKRGTGDEPELTGTSTSLFVNDTPYKNNEFDKFISGIITEDVFKLLTSTTFFNVQMSWQERRKLLTSLIVDHPYSEIAAKPVYTKIKYDVIKYGIDATEDKFRYRLKELRKNISDLPARIDESSKNINRDSLRDTSELKTLREETISKIDNLQRKGNAEYISQRNILMESLSEIGKKISESDHKSFVPDSLVKAIEAQKMKDKIYVLEITTLNQAISSIRNRIDAAEYERMVIKESFLSMMSSIYNPDSTTCPTCGQELPDNMKKDAETRWNRNKSAKLDEMKSAAGDLKEEVGNLSKELSLKETSLIKKTEEMEQNRVSLKKLENNILLTPNHTEPIDIIVNLNNEKAAIEKELSSLNPNPYREEIFGLNQELDITNSQLADYESSEKAKIRVNELESQLRKASEDLLETEELISLCESIKREYIETVEGDLNSLFDRKLKIRLFEEQVNGGFRETCDILVQNRQGALVPWQFVNTAGQINSSLMIIDQLSNHMGIYCPVFVDHSESVEALYPIESQVIELKFQSTYTKLSVK